MITQNGYYATTLGNMRRAWTTDGLRYWHLRRALFGEGQEERGVVLLVQAAATGWDANTFLDLSGAKLSRGERREGMKILARVAVDPGVTSSIIDFIELVRRGLVDIDDWEAMRAEAEALMHERVLATLDVPRRVDSSVLLANRDGQLRSLGELAAGRVTLVAFWDRFSAPSREALVRMQEVAHIVARQGGSVVTILSETPLCDVDSFLSDHASDLPVFFDVQGKAAETFEAFGDPLYFVIDASQRIRFAYAELDAVPRQVSALLALEQKGPRVVD